MQRRQNMQTVAKQQSLPFLKVTFHAPTRIMTTAQGRTKKTTPRAVDIQRAHQVAREAAEWNPAGKSGGVGFVLLKEGGDADGVRLLLRDRVMLLDAASGSEMSNRSWGGTRGGLTSSPGGLPLPLLRTALRVV